MTLRGRREEDQCKNSLFQLFSALLEIHLEDLMIGMVEEGEGVSPALLCGEAELQEGGLLFGVIPNQSNT